MIFYYCSLFVGSVILLYFMYKNNYQRIERYYFKKDRKMYYLLRACHFILLMAIVLNIRFVIYNYAFDFLKQYKKT